MHAVQPPEVKRERESIHSGHFMVSTFEAEEQDDEDEVAVPISEVVETNTTITTIVPVKQYPRNLMCTRNTQQQQLSIDTSLSKLFQCMSLAYRQKLTSPKWNRFRGIRLRWKDKIRLNNVIWRCWHMQFIKKQNTLICQFASPLDVDTHNKPEAVVLEGKYWKRKLAAVTAEYKKCRLFYRNHALGQTAKEDVDMLHDVDLLTWNSNSSENMSMMVDEDYMGLMSDTLFSTITNQPFAFPDSREIARAGLADFIQPSLGPLQPNLDDYMDTFEPLHEFVNCKLPTVPEEQGHSHTASWNMPDFFEMQQQQSHANLQMNAQVEQFMGAMKSDQIAYSTISLAPPSYHSSVISKLPKKSLAPSQGKLGQVQNVYSYGADQNMQRTNILSLQDQQMMSAQPPQSVQPFKLPHQSPNESSGYKFAAPVVPNIKFTSQVVPHMMQPNSHSVHSQYNSLSIKEEKSDNRIRAAPRGRQRSRSGTREPHKRPPLLPSVSDPSLLNSRNSVLLTQLLSNSAEGDAYSRSVMEHSKQVRIKEENSPIPILPQPPQPTTLIITPVTINPVTINPVQSPSTDPLALNSFSSSNSPILESSQSVNSPTSSQGSIGSPNRDNPHRDQRRVGHIHAEQKRRYNIKNGFDMIHSLIPHLNQNPNAKLSKAAMLQKGAEYIRQLRSERHQLNEEMDCLRQQIETLNTSISNCQSMLPATGAPVSRRRDSKMQEMFDEYIKKRTMENWKYWIFSLLFRPLLDSFNNFVSTSSFDDLYRSTVLWIEQHCTLVDLRPVVLNSLKYLSTKTDILSEPEKLPEEARQMVLTKTPK